LDCQLTLRNAEEYRAHVQIFPTHNVRPVTNLVCPKCGREVNLEEGSFAEHWLWYPPKKCPGSGKTA
jgi:hypothetical protein